MLLFRSTTLAPGHQLCAPPYPLPTIPPHVDIHLPYVFPPARYPCPPLTLRLLAPPAPTNFPLSLLRWRHNGPHVPPFPVSPELLATVDSTHYYPFGCRLPTLIVWWPFPGRRCVALALAKSCVCEPRRQKRKAGIQGVPSTPCGRPCGSSYGGFCVLQCVT